MQATPRTGITNRAEQTEIVTENAGRLLRPHVLDAEELPRKASVPMPVDEGLVELFGTRFTVHCVAKRGSTCAILEQSTGSP